MLLMWVFVDVESWHEVDKMRGRVAQYLLHWPRTLMVRVLRMMGESVVRRRRILLTFRALFQRWIDSSRQLLWLWLCWLWKKCRHLRISIKHCSVVRIAILNWSWNKNWTWIGRMHYVLYCVPLNKSWRGYTTQKKSKKLSDFTWSGPPDWRLVYVDVLWHFFGVEDNVEDFVHLLHHRLRRGSVLGVRVPALEYHVGVNTVTLTLKSERQFINLNIHNFPISSHSQLTLTMYFWKAYR